MAFVASFLVRRLAQSLVIIFLVTLLIFTLLRVVPGDPVRMIAGPMATQETVDKMATDLGLHDPLLVQYGRYMGRVLKGDFGTSFVRPKSGQTTGGGRANDPTRLDRAEVLDLVLDRLPLTLQLAGLAILFALAIAVPIGCMAGIWRTRWPDNLAVLASSVMVSIPNFWFGLVLALTFSIQLGWLPAVGYRGFSYTILPAVVLAVELAPILMRAISLSLGAALGEAYIRAGEVRGLSRRRMIWLHAARNASVPVLNMFGIQLGTLLGGVLIVEFIFDYPGVGHLAINAVLQRDFPLIQAVTILAATMFIFVNMMVDLISSLLDPRLEY